MLCLQSSKPAGCKRSACKCISNLNRIKHKCLRGLLMQGTTASYWPLLTASRPNCSELIPGCWFSCHVLVSDSGKGDRTLWSWSCCMVVGGQQNVLRTLCHSAWHRSCCVPVGDCLLPRSLKYSILQAWEDLGAKQPGAWGEEGRRSLGKQHPAEPERCF